MFKIFERLWYRLFGFWYPLRYENYKDVSYSKTGAPSHTIIYINLMNGKLKTVHYFNKGYVDDDLFILMRKIKSFEIDELGLKINFKIEEI
ncbi:hypothetical protein [Gallibacterium sp. ZY190522]